MLVSLLFALAHVLEVSTTTIKTHLNALQEAGAHSLRGVCWHFTHVLLDAEAQLFHATRLVAANAVLASCRLSKTSSPAG